MRVVAGDVKGHHLRMPKGIGTRPTSDKVREATFAILGGRFEELPVLDLFAGTGALGIEALSRGASQATFVERNRAACQAIRANLEHTRYEDESRLLCMPVERALEVLDAPFSLILLDPPYEYPGLHGIMALIGRARVIEEDTTVVFEHSPRFCVRDRYQTLVLQRQKVYGDTAISIFVVREERTE
ncbi:MAG: 16S rRNA (guanine(966)-N(2))-methyltransferase RsmD [Chloroflexota bacterium]